MAYGLAALLANLVLTSIRVWRFTPPIARSDGRYLALLACGLLADVIASYGFLALIRQPPAQIKHYGLIIAGLSLLAAVALIVKFAFLRDGAPALQRLRGWISTVTVIVTPMYLPLLLGRSSTVEASKLGSKRPATWVTACTKPSTFSPITLMGN